MYDYTGIIITNQPNKIGTVSSEMCNHTIVKDV